MEPDGHWAEAKGPHPSSGRARGQDQVEEDSGELLEQGGSRNKSWETIPSPCPPFLWALGLLERMFEAGTLLSG